MSKAGEKKKVEDQVEAVVEAKKRNNQKKLLLSGVEKVKFGGLIVSMPTKSDVRNKPERKRVRQMKAHQAIRKGYDDDKKLRYL